MLLRARWARDDRDPSGLYTPLRSGNSNCRQRGILIVANHTAMSLARNGRPLASSKIRWFKVRRCRNPVRQSAAS